MQKEGDKNNLKRKFIRKHNPDISSEIEELIVNNPIPDPARSGVKLKNTLFSLRGFQNRLEEYGHSIVSSRLEEGREELDAFEPKIEKRVDKLHSEVISKYPKFTTALGIDEEARTNADTQPVLTFKEDDIPPYINGVVKSSKNATQILEEQRNKAEESRKALRIFHRELGRRTIE